MFKFILNKKYIICFFIIFQYLLNIIIIDKNHNHIKFDKIKNNLHLSPRNFNEFLINNLTDNNEKNATLLKGRKFLDKCLNSTNNHTYQKNENPDISVIIPSYNCEKTIVASIHSAQYQNFSNIEFIIVDDFSIDKTKSVINNIRVFDKRIKFIENKKNMGTLYSRCIGALLSQGNYILSLDNDDLFFDEDVFDFLFKKVKSNNLDLLSFRVLSFTNYFDGISKMKNYRFLGFKNNLFLSQPQLGIFPITFNGSLAIHDNEIWSKIIKLIVYKEAVNLLGIQRYSKYVCWAEDTNINFIIFNIASTFQYCHKYGYIHIYRKESASHTQNINNKLYGELFFLDVMFDFSHNTSDKNYAVSYALRIKELYKLNNFINSTIDNYLKIILCKIIKSKYITNKNRNRLELSFKRILFNN